MSQSQRVRPLDVRALLFLIGELGELAREPVVTRRRHALFGLCKLLGARVGGYSRLTHGRSAPRGFELDELQLVGFRSEEEQTLRAYLAQPASLADNPVARYVQDRWTRARSRPLYLAARDVMPAQLWYRHRYVQDVLRSCNVDSFLAATTREGANGRVRFLTIRRAWRERPFSSRARQIFLLFQEAADHLLHADEAEQGDASGDATGDARECIPGLEGCSSGAAIATCHWNERRLSCRQRMVLERLLSGDSEKQVAAHLGRSRHTVHRHVTALYRRFRVSSRAELMARFLAGEPAFAPLVGSDPNT